MGYFTLNPTSIRSFMPPEKKISPNELRNGKCEVIRLLKQIFVQEDPVFRFQRTLFAPSTGDDARFCQV